MNVLFGVTLRRFISLLVIAYSTQNDLCIYNNKKNKWTWGERQTRSTRGERGTGSTRGERQTQTPHGERETDRLHTGRERDRLHTGRERQAPHREIERQTPTGFEPGTLWLWGSSANHCASTTPVVEAERIWGHSASSSSGNKLKKRMDKNVRKKT